MTRIGHTCQKWPIAPIALANHNDLPHYSTMMGDLLGLNTPTDVEADLQVGPTDQGMVRLYIQGPQIDLPLDFDPEDAEAIAEELMAAAAAARRQTGAGRH